MTKAEEIETAYYCVRFHNCFACSMIFENDNCYEYCEQLIGGIVEKAIQEAEEKEKENV